MSILKRDCICTFNRDACAAISEKASKSAVELDVLAALGEKLKASFYIQKEAVPPPILDDLVFLPANLTRLLIDPYREECLTDAHIGSDDTGSLKLDIPWVIGGLDFGKMPQAQQEAIAMSATQTGCAVRVPASFAELYKGCNTIVCVSGDDALPGFAPAAVEITGFPETENRALWLEKVRNRFPKIPAGILAQPETASETVQLAIEAKMDFVTILATPSSQNGSFCEVTLPDIRPLYNAVQKARLLRAEERLSMLFGGYVWCGADAARAMALGATAVVLASPVLTALGAAGSDDPQDMAEHLTRFLAASTQEISMLARVCGKTRTRNLEPEDLRSLTPATSMATGVPLAGSDRIYGQDHSLRFSGSP